jgi:chemotaxis protein MotA
MFAIIGLVLMLVCIAIGYSSEGGNLSILIQPVELLIIFGVAIGAFLIANTPAVISSVVKDLPKVFSAKSPDKKTFLELLILLYQIFSKIKRDGALSIEPELEDPHKSEFFKKYKSVVSNHHLLTFLCDNLKVIVAGKIPAHELDNLMDVEIEAIHHEEMEASHGVYRVADGMPGLGLVAAVLGVVLTCGRLDQPPTVIGEGVAVALLGTFMGILCCYGIIGPMSVNLENQAYENGNFFLMCKVALVAFVGGTTPALAVEFARRVVPGYAKPSFGELEEARKKG